MLNGSSASVWISLIIVFSLLSKSLERPINICLCTFTPVYSMCASTSIRGISILKNRSVSPISNNFLYKTSLSSKSEDALSIIVFLSFGIVISVSRKSSKIDLIL